MLTASGVFTSDQRTRVNDAVAQAESSTSAEFLAVCATASGRYDRAEDLAGLWLGIALLSLMWIAFQRMSIAWDEPQLRLGLAPIVLIMFLSFLIGTVIASHVGWLRRIFTPRSEMIMEVNTRARQVFFDQRVRQTAGRGGVLVYISLFERMAVVLADEKAAEGLGERGVRELCDALTQRLRVKADIAEALCETIRSAGSQLAASLPRQPGDANELPDTLVTID